METVLIEDGYKFYDITDLIQNEMIQANCNYDEAIKSLMKTYKCDKVGTGRNFSVAYQNLVIAIWLNKG